MSESAKRLAERILEIWVMPTTYNRDKLEEWLSSPGLSWLPEHIKRKAREIEAMPAVVMKTRDGRIFAWWSDWWVHFRRISRMMRRGEANEA
jgi:hypothetical protein